MEIHGINSDDYVYFKLCVEDNEIGHFPYFYNYLKEGTILRFKVNELKELLWRSGFLQNLDCFEIIPNPEASKYDFSPKYAYKKITVIEDIDLVLNMRAYDILLISDILWNKLNSTEILSANNNSLGRLFGSIEFASPVERNHYYLKHTKLIKYDGTEYAGSDVFMPNRKVKLSAKPLQKLLPGQSDITENEKLVDCYQFGNDEIIVVPLRKGEILNFNSLVCNLLFLNQDWMRFLSCMYPLTEEEQLRYFEKEFSGYIPEANRRYFKLHDYIKIHSLEELFNSEIFNLIRKRVPDFRNPIDYFDYEKYSTLDDFDYDTDGFLRYIWCDNDNYLKEYEISKIADRISYDEGKEHFIHEKCMKELIEKERELKRIAEEYVKKHKNRYRVRVRENPQLSYIEFMQSEENKQLEAKRVLVKRLVKTLKNRISPN